MRGFVLFLLLAALASSAAIHGRGREKSPVQVLWEYPGAVETKNLAAGAGGPGMAPRAPFRFLEEDMGGSSPKLRVRDAAGRIWSMKFGQEVHSDVAAARLVWAVGYTIEPSHFVAAGRVLGVHDLKRAKGVVSADGAFRDARFQLRSTKEKFSKQFNWSWANNPFLGTHELAGLKVMVMLTSDWDDKDARDIDRDANTAIFEERAGRFTRYIYFLPDWGGSFGRWGGVARRSKWDCKGYSSENAAFVKGLHKGQIEWGYSGQRSDVTHGVSVEDVQWLMRYLGRITDRQLRDALRSAGATPEETECFANSLRYRIERLRQLR